MRLIQQVVFSSFTMPHRVLWRIKKKTKMFLALTVIQTVTSSLGCIKQRAAALRFFFSCLEFTFQLGLAMLLSWCSPGMKQVLP